MILKGTCSYITFLFLKCRINIEFLLYSQPLMTLYEFQSFLLCAITHYFTISATYFPPEPNGLTSTYSNPFKFIMALGDYGQRSGWHTMTFRNSPLTIPHLFRLKMRSCVKMISYSFFMVGVQSFISFLSSWFIKAAEGADSYQLFTQSTM